MDKTSKSILEDLYTDGGGFDRERAAHALKIVLTIQRDEHKVFFKKDDMRAEDKVLAYALVKKLLKAEGVAESGNFSGRELKKQTDIRPGTVDVMIKKLREERLLVGSGSNYETPTHKIQTVIERLEKYGKI